MKYIATLIVVLGSTLLFIHTATAHTLITDQSGQKGAILHVNPDDDPIAGKEASLYFDTQNNLLTEDSSVDLVIQQENSTPATVKTTIEGSLVTANYIFPSQGVYHLRYTINTAEATYTFTEVLRVARGIQNHSQNTPRYSWAEGLLIGCIVAFLGLLIIVWNYRKDIARQSSF